MDGKWLSQLVWRRLAHVGWRRLVQADRRGLAQVDVTRQHKTDL